MPANAIVPVEAQLSFNAFGAIGPSYRNRRFDQGLWTDHDL